LTVGKSQLLANTEEEKYINAEDLKRNGQRRREDTQRI
jgi:hypothetical protein